MYRHLEPLRQTASYVYLWRKERSFFFPPRIILTPRCHVEEGQETGNFFSGSEQRFEAVNSPLQEKKPEIGMTELPR